MRKGAMNSICHDGRKRRLRIANPHRLFHATFAISLLLACIRSSTSQTIGVDICACSPSVYTFQLIFSLTCAEETVKDNPGIQGESCFVQGLRQEEGVTDFV